MEVSNGLAQPLAEAPPKASVSCSRVEMARMAARSACAGSRPSCSIRPVSV
jgi:hypothetical protein